MQAFYGTLLLLFSSFSSSSQASSSSQVEETGEGAELINTSAALRVRQSSISTIQSINYICANGETTLPPEPTESTGSQCRRVQEQEIEMKESRKTVRH